MVSPDRVARPHVTPGSDYQVIDLLGCKIGFLICDDCNLPGNVRITTMLGAEIIFMQHVTGCLPSPMPGRGAVDKSLSERGNARDMNDDGRPIEESNGHVPGWIASWKSFTV